MISVKNLSIKYGSHLAVRDVSLEIPTGQITAIVGPSGCGKSSFLSSINRLSDLTPGVEVSGEIFLDNGREVLGDEQLDLLELRRKVGMVFQKPNPFPLSIRKNFELPLKEMKVPAAEIEERMSSSLKEVGLWEEVSERLNRSAEKLSGGQQQRLCIARALALRPEAILFDEPCSALDPLASGVVEDRIAALRGKVTVVIVTHNLAQARRIADQIAVFWVRDGAGCLIETGKAEEVFSNPQDEDTKLYFSGERG